MQLLKYDELDSSKNWAITLEWAFFLLIFKFSISVGGNQRGSKTIAGQYGYSYDFNQTTSPYL